MPFSLGPIGGGTPSKQQDIGVRDGGGQGGRYNQQDKDDSMMGMGNDVSGINDISNNLGNGEVSGNDILPELPFHEPEPVKE